MKTVNYILIAIGLMMIAGCDAFEAPVYHEDPKLRQEIFFKCMQSLPAGPQSTKYNDWDEVVSECGSQAYYLAKSCVKNCH
jgi:hypothetical protein